MLLKTNKTVDETAYLENWPAHYYEIKDIDLREKLLKEKLVDNQESTDDKRRLEILERRYAGRISGGKRPDHFVGAWMNILIDGRSATTFFNKKRIERKLIQYYTDLGVLHDEHDDVLLAEWKDFSELWIKMCANDRTYNSQFMGFMKLSDRSLAQKIALEMFDVTRNIPKRLGIEKEAEDLYHIFFETYRNSIEDADQILRSDPRFLH